MSYCKQKKGWDVLWLPLGEPDDVLEFCEMTVLNHPIGFIDT